MSLQNLENSDEQADDFAERNQLDIYAVYVKYVSKLIDTRTIRNLLSLHGEIVYFYRFDTIVICRYEEPWQAQAAIRALSGKKPLGMSITLAKKSFKNRNSNSSKRSPNQQENDGRNYMKSDNVSKWKNSPNNNATGARPKNSVHKQQVGNKKYPKSDRFNVRHSYKMQRSRRSNVNTKCICETSENENEYLNQDKNEEIFIVSRKPCVFCSRQIEITRQFSIHCDDDFERELSPHHSSVALPSKDSTLKSLHDNLETGFKILSTPLVRLPNGDWICLLINQEYVIKYNSLFEEFTNECNKKHKNNDNAVKDNAVVAVCILEDCTNVWYRGIAFANGRYALIDKGTVVKKSEVLQIVECPEKFANIARFCSVLTVLPKYVNNSEFYLKPTNNFLLEVVLKNETICLVALNNVMVATLTTWNFDNYIENAPTKQAEAFSNEPFTFSFPPPNITNYDNSITTKPPTILMLKNNSIVVVVNYVSSKEVYVRLHGMDELIKYNLLLNDVSASAYSKKSLTTPPKLKTFVLCKYENDFYRATVLEYNIDLDIYRVAYVDIGSIKWVKLSDMKKCNQDISERPMMLMRVSLKGSDSIYKAEPSTKVNDLMTTFIDNNIPMLCTFKGLNHIESEVQLTMQLSKTDINHELVKLTLPVYDRLQIENKKPNELPVIMLAEVDQINFDDITDLKKSKIKLVVLDTSQLVNLKYITCTKVDQAAMNRFNVILKQINEYCTKQTECYLPMRSETCLAFDENDQSWHRGVATTEKNENVTILFLDYIKMAVVHISKIRKMISDFVELPFIGSSCHIAGIPNDCQKNVLMRATEILDGMTTIDVSLISLSMDEDNLAFYCMKIPKLIAKLKSEDLL